MSKYVVKRKDVCAGQLIKKMDIEFKIFDAENNEISREELEKRGILNFSASAGIICRGMLFRVDENGLANDLVYTTPTPYRIDRIEPQQETDKNLIINDYVELEELLKYLKYGEDLTQKDLNTIHKKLITHDRWLRNHMELFGWQRTAFGEKDGNDTTLSTSIYYNLRRIETVRNGKPHPEEPGYSHIKKRTTPIFGK